MQPVMQLEALQARAQQLARTLELEMRRRMEQILLEAPQATSVNKLLVLAPPLIVARMPVMQAQLTPLVSLMALMLVLCRVLHTALRVLRQSDHLAPFQVLRLVLLALPVL